MGSELEQSSSAFLYSDIFEQAFPYYLAMGMTYSEFWEKDVNLVKAYRKAQSIKTQQENEKAWLNGLYTYSALCSVSPVLHAFAKAGTKPLDYMSKPITVDKEQIEREKQEAEINKRNKFKAQMLKWAITVNKKMKGKT